MNAANVFSYCDMHTALLFLSITGMITVINSQIDEIEWLSPFDDRSRVAALCTQENRQLIMHRSGAVVLFRLFRHDVLCWREIQRYVPPRYSALVWFLQSLGYCEVNRVVDWRRPGIEYSRAFQLYITRAAFALVCQQTDDIGTYHLAKYAALFRILFEKDNNDRSIICQRIQNLYRDLFERCLVYKPTGRMRLLEKICSGRSMVRLINMRAFFRRFSRNCYTFDDFFANELPKYSSFGEALSNDTNFLNLLSSNLVVAISSDSRLPEIVLKTRFLLQHFSVAAVKLQQQIEKADLCTQQREKVQLILDNNESERNISSISSGGNGTDFDYDGDGDIDEYDQCPRDKRNFFIHMQLGREIRTIAQYAKFGLYLEAFLLLLVVLNTVILSVLLWKSYKHLSTATVLFIFNIIFSNALFIISFTLLLLHALSDKPFGTLDDEHFDGSLPASLAIAETLNTHLFATNKFAVHMVEETLYSLAQNGSLLGLTNLLVLVLVVINRSMAGKAIRLSRKSVISIFSLIWIFLFLTHSVFSSLQLTAIHAIGEMFSGLAASRFDIDCQSMLLSDYNTIGGLCDRVSPFHNFGVYLLRGHTFFTLIFSVIAMVIFVLTVVYHSNIRRQNDMLAGEAGERTPLRRREMLFNTLLVSLCVYFLSVAGQSFLEIAVFWAEDREGVAELARWFQLARIAAFIDPLFDPLLVTLRTPTMRSKLRRCWRYVNRYMLLLLGCQFHRKTAKRRRSRRRKGSTSAATGESSNSPFTTHSDENSSKNIFQFLCLRNVQRLSLSSRHLNSGEKSIV